MFKIISSIVLMFLLYALLNMYVGWHGLLLLEWLQIEVSLPLYWSVYAFLAFSYVFVRMPFLRGRLQAGLQWIAAWFIALFYFSFLLLPVIDGLFWLSTIYFSEYENVTMSASVLIYVLSISFIFYKGYWNARNPIVRHHYITIEQKKPLQREVQLLVASDLHLGHLVGIHQLRKLEAIAATMKPDVLLLPGDVVDDDPQAFVEAGMAEVMRQIVAHTRLGAFAVLGNHEYYGGKIDAYVKIMESIGVRVLRDESTLMIPNIDDAFYIVGRKDFTEQQYRRERKSVAELTATLSRELAVIMMDHQPRTFAEAEAAGVDLLLCGHTHRGQFAPNHLITRRLFELDWGYLKKERMHVIVSSGFGTWGPPIRLASRAEVLTITLKI